MDRKESGVIAWAVVPARLSRKASAIPCIFMRFIRSSDIAFWSGCWLTGAVLSFVVIVVYVFFVVDAVVFAPPDVFVHRRGG